MNYSLKTYKNKQIICCNFNNCKSDTEMIQLCEEAYNVAKSIDAGGKHLILCNFTGIKSTKQFLEESRNFGLRTAGIAEKIAIVGVVGARRFLVESYMLFTGQWDMKNFNTEKEALAWLIA